MKKKKGFTLVELLVVIAILAILAAVSVVGYLSFTEKAKLSNDQATIKMINDNLQAAHVNNEPESVVDTFNDLYNLGFTDEKLVAYSSGHKYLYNEADDKFYLANEKGEIIYPKELNDKACLWAIYRDNGDKDTVVGITNYIVNKSIFNEEKFAQAFNEGEYLINLNNYFLPKIDTLSNEANITLTNGTVEDKGSFNFNENDNSIDVAKEFNDDLSKNKHYNGVYENLVFRKKINFGGTSTLFGSNGKIIFENCKIEGNSDDSSFQPVVNNIDEINEVIINKCRFKNFEEQNALSISSFGKLKYTITNNLFIDCARGINLQFHNLDSSILTGTMIKYNKFKLSTIEEGHMVQISDINDENSKYLSNLNKPIFEISDNELISGLAVVELHESLAKGNLKEDVLRNLVSIKNNELNGVNVLFIPDRDKDQEITSKLNNYIEILKKYNRN